MQVAGARATPTILQLTFFANKTYLPTSLDVQVMATYLTSSGEPRACSHVLALPLAMSCRLRPAAKTAPLKLTLDTQHPPQKLNGLFADFIHCESSTGSDLGDLLDSSGGWIRAFIVMSDLPLPLDLTNNCVSVIGGEMALGFLFWSKGASSHLLDKSGGDKGNGGDHGSGASSGACLRACLILPAGSRP